MGMIIPHLKIHVMLGSKPLKSRILVRRSAIWLITACGHICLSSTAAAAAGAASARKETRRKTRQGLSPRHARHKRVAVSVCTGRHNHSRSGEGVGKEGLEYVKLWYVCLDAMVYLVLVVHVVSWLLKQQTTTYFWNYSCYTSVRQTVP